MSYCRFSSDNWRSDVYVYEHCGGGFVTHVAGMRRVLPAIPDISHRYAPRWGCEWSRENGLSYPSRWHRRAAAVTNYIAWMWNGLSMWSVRISPLKEIGLPHDGDQFCDDTAGECADRLESLRALGYHVPESAIKALREEAVLPEDAP